MKERFIDIETPSGRMGTFVTHPEHDGPFPAVIIYMDIWGVRDELFEIARRVGTVGYYCLVPDFYYREGTVRHEFRDEQNRMISLHALDEERRQRVIAPGRRLTMFELADALLVSRSGATRLIDRLEKRGWVDRRIAPHDRRVVRAELTREGAAAFAHMGAVFAAAFEERFGGLLSDEEVAALRGVLAKLLAASTPGAAT